MKLTSTLRLRPDFLYLAPMMNVVMLMLVFFLLNSSLVVQSGVRVELPQSFSSLQPLERAHVLTLTAGKDYAIYFNKERIELSDLPAKLKTAKAISPHVIISADALAAHGLVVKVQDAIWKAGCQPVLATQLPP